MTTTIAAASTEQLHFYADKYRALIGQLNNADQLDNDFYNKNLVVLATIVTELRDRAKAGA